MSRSGIVTDVSGVYERMSVYDNLKYFARLLNVPLREIDPLLKRIGLYEHRKKPAAKLSKGQTQRLILARAILHKPKVLFLDEPTSGLDPSTALEVHKLLMELRDEGMSIFLTTHNMEEATKLCSHVALLNEGVIVEYGSPEEICLKYNRNKKYRVQLTDGTRHLLEQSPQTAAKIASWMSSGEIETLHSCEPTLETVFLEVTGRGITMKNETSTSAETCRDHRSKRKGSVQQELYHHAHLFHRVYFPDEKPSTGQSQKAPLI